MSKKDPTVRTVVRFPASIRAEMQEQARAMGFEDGRGPGLSKYLLSLHAANVGQIGPAEEVPEAVTFEGMTPGEQWMFVFRVAIRESDHAIRSVAVGMAADSGETHEQRGEAIASWRDDSTPGYQARYEAALAYVKGVMDAG